MIFCIFLEFLDDASTTKKEELFEEWLTDPDPDLIEEVGLKIEVIQPEDFFENMTIYNDEEEAAEDAPFNPVISEKFDICEKRLSRLSKNEHVPTNETTSCQQSIDDSPEIIEHLKGHNTKTKEPTVDFTRAINSKQYQNVSKCKNEKKLSQSYTRRKFSCKACGLFFFTINNLKEHLTTHTEDSVFPCTYCKERFTTVNYLKKHIVYIHERSLRCEFCETMLGNRYDLLAHLRKHPPHGRRCDCKFCRSLQSDSDAGLKNVKDEREPTLSKTEPALPDVESNNDVESISVASGGNYEFTCSVCSTSFKDKFELKAHLISHNNETQLECTNSNEIDRKRFQCTFCHLSFPNYPVLKRHLKIHDDSLKCHICDEMFSKLSYLKRHIQHVHEKPFRCDECNRRFGRRREFTLHIAKHGITLPSAQNSSPKSVSLPSSGQIDTCIECTRCKETFVSTADLTRHMEQTHLQPREYVCYMCDKAFLLLRNVKRHMLLHSQENRLLCNICGRKLSSVQSLKFHIMSHSGEKPYQCTICENKWFRRIGDLKSHMIRHTGNKPFECDLCDKRFGVAYQLKIHKMVHNDERPFKCEVCYKGFRTASNLKEHILAHTGVKPHVCQICNKHYRKRGNLTAHEKHCRTIMEGKTDDGEPS